MPLLTVNYSKLLAALSREGFDGFDGIEIGLWFSPEQIRSSRAMLPGKPFYFHAGSVMTPMKRNGRFPGRLQDYLDFTESPWISFHIELLPLHVFRLSQHLGLHLPPPGTEKAVQQYIAALLRIREATGCPIILENLHSIPGERYNYAASPEVITDLLAQTDCGLLLDLAHARVAAGFQGVEVRRYIERLPLDRVMQVHVSGPRMKHGRLFDSHESMGEADYELLEWILGVSSPQVVTLEYFREQEPLREQLERIRELLDMY